MPRIVVLFNLKQGVSAAEYEAWARGTDAPTVRGLGAVTSFTIHRATGLLGGGPSPYQYVEVLDFTDMDLLLADISADPMPEIAAAFQAFADAPHFIVTEDLD
ncbi:MAG: REDY-like protein HapK [Pseudomonadota bacterium]